MENLEGPNSLFKVSDRQNSGKLRNSGKILVNGLVIPLLQGFTVFNNFRSRLLIEVDL